MQNYKNRNKEIIISKSDLHSIYSSLDALTSKPLSLRKHYNKTVIFHVNRLITLFRKYYSFTFNADMFILDHCRSIVINQHIWRAIFSCLTSDRIIAICHEKKSLDANLVALTGERENNDPFLVLSQKLTFCDYLNDKELWNALYESNKLASKDMIGLCTRHFKMFEVALEHPGALQHEEVMTICTQHDTAMYWIAAGLATDNIDHAVDIINAAHSMKVYLFIKKRHMFSIEHYERMIKASHHPLKSIFKAIIRYEKRSKDKNLSTLGKNLKLRLQIFLSTRFRRFVPKHHQANETHGKKGWVLFPVFSYYTMMLSIISYIYAISFSFL